MQIMLELCQESENRKVDLLLLININREEDASTSLSSNRDVKNIGKIDKSKVIKKKTRT